MKGKRLFRISETYYGMELYFTGGVLMLRNGKEDAQINRIKSLVAEAMDLKRRGIEVVIEDYVNYYLDEEGY